MKIRFAAAVLAAALGAPALANVESYSIDPQHTIPVFEISHFGFSTQRGSLGNASGKVTLDRAAKKGTIDVTVNVASIFTGDAKRDEHLRKEDFFDIAKHSTANFKSSRLAFDGDALVGAEGELTLLGVTKPVVLKVSNFKCGAHPFNKKTMCGAEATTTIRRSDFGMKYGIPAVGDDVRIAIAIESYQD
jgi:polyisoprenoid-binding protein YceI